MQAVTDVPRLGSNDLYKRGLCLNSWRGQGFGDVSKRRTVCVTQAKSYQSQNSQSHNYHGLGRGALFWGSLRSKRMSICRAKRSWRSSDDEVDSMDISLSTELRQRADPKYLSKVAQHLNVVWNVASKSCKLRAQVSAENYCKPESCACCHGTGETGCGYCRGSGALTLGNEIFCSIENGCKRCPVCKAKGSVKCLHCQGTGFRAAWMEPPTCST